MEYYKDQLIALFAKFKITINEELIKICSNDKIKDMKSDENDLEYMNMRDDEYIIKYTCISSSTNIITKHCNDCGDLEPPIQFGNYCKNCSNKLVDGKCKECFKYCYTCGNKLIDICCVYKVKEYVITNYGNIKKCTFIENRHGSRNNWTVSDVEVDTIFLNETKLTNCLIMLIKNIKDFDIKNNGYQFMTELCEINNDIIIKNK